MSLKGFRLIQLLSWTSCLQALMVESQGPARRGLWVGPGLQDEEWSPVEAPEGQHRRLRFWLLSHHLKIRIVCFGSSCWRGANLYFPYPSQASPLGLLLVGVWPLSQVSLPDWLPNLMEERAQAAAKGVIFIRVLETWDTAAEQPGCGDGQGEHTMKEALKEAGGLEPGSETQLSLRTKPVKLRARIHEMVFT